MTLEQRVDAGTLPGSGTTVGEDDHHAGASPAGVSPSAKRRPREIAANGLHVLPVHAERLDGLRVPRVPGELELTTASAFAECTSQALHDTDGPVRAGLSGLAVVGELGGLSLAPVIETIPPGLPPTARTGPEYETPRLVNRVREARLHAVEARQEASRILVQISKTTVKVARTHQRTVRARDQGRQLVDSSRAVRERVIRPRAAPLTSSGDTLTDPVIKDCLDSSSVTLRRAVAFVDKHADRHLTVADIAAASFVTVRAVQLAFRRHLDMTPMEYLRRVRLRRAHQDLVAADPARESVTAVAYRWGFASASRFTAYYRSAYGVLPSATLRG